MAAIAENAQSGAAGGTQSAFVQRLRAFWRWWSGELLQLLPRGWVEMASVAGGPILLLGGEDIVIREVRAGRAAEAGRARIASLDPAGQKIALRGLLQDVQGGTGESIRLGLDASQCLVKRIALPIATEENLYDVLGYEMDRHTPFSAAQVYYDCRIVERHADRATIVVEFAAAPRAALDALVGRVEAMGGTVAGAVPLELAAGAAHFDLLRQRTGTRRIAASPLRNVNIALAVLLLAVLGTAVVIPIWQKRAAAIALLPKLGKAKDQALAAESVRTELEKLVAENNFVLSRKHSGQAAISVIEDLSRVLPDSTWVHVLELKAGAKTREVVVTGETSSSSKLVELIEQTGSLQNASFRSPLTKGQAPNSERFVIGAEVKPHELPPRLAIAPAAAAVPVTAPSGIPPGTQSPAAAQGSAQAQAATSVPAFPVSPAVTAAEVRPAAPADTKAGEHAKPQGKN